MRSTESSPASSRSAASARGPAQSKHGHPVGLQRGQLAVSVVMSTHGGSAATETTLASLCEQIGGWELVVQTTAVPEIAGSQPWLLFIDAGDTLHAGMLARVRAVIAGDPSLDAVHCGWTIVDEDDHPVIEERCNDEGDLFDLLARQPAFPSCACVVRRSVVEMAGGFDRSMGAAAEWVLWQRIARRGARFARIDESLVTRHSRVARRTSPADDAKGALRAIALGHRADPALRVSRTSPYAAGRLARADAAEVNALCAAAARELAHGRDASRLVELLPAGRRVADAHAAAAAIVRGAPLALAERPAWWATHWEERREALDAFLAVLERRVEEPGIALAIAARAQRLVLPLLDPETPLPPAVAGTHLGIVDVAAPIDDLRVDRSTATVQLRVLLERKVLGTIELTPIEGRVSTLAIRAAIAEGWAEQVLEHYLARHADEGSLADMLWEPDHLLFKHFANAIDRIAAGVRGDDGRHRGPPRTIVVEAGHPLPAFTFGTRNITAELRVAGRRAGSTEVIVGRLGVVSRRALRAALCKASAPALARIVVRDLLLGAPLFGGRPLHERSRSLGAVSRRAV